MFCFYLNVLFTQELYDKNKYEKNKVEKERLKTLYLVSRAAIIKYHKLGGLATEMYCLTVLETKFKIKVSAGLFPSEACEGRDLF